MFLYILQDPYNKPHSSCQTSGQIFWDTSKESVYLNFSISRDKLMILENFINMDARGKYGDK